MLKCNSRPAPTTSWCHAAGDDLLAASRGAFSPLARRVSAAARCQENRDAGGRPACGGPAGGIATSVDSRGVDFTFSEGLLVLAGQAADVGQSHVELPIGYSGPEVTITLGSALRGRFPQGLGSGKDIHTGVERFGKRRGRHDRRWLWLRDHAAGPRSIISPFRACKKPTTSVSGLN